MESAKKNPDNLNTIGIITVGGVGAALVYLSIVGLQAFYVDETAIVEEVRQFGDQEKVRASLKAEQMGHITSDLTRKGVTAEGKPIIAIPIDEAKKLVVEGAKIDPSNLVPIVGKSDATTIQPIFGRPLALPPPPPAAVPPPADGSVPGATPPDGTVPPGGTATPPAGGTATPPAGGTATPPAGGTATPPAGGTATTPAGGTATPRPPATTPAPTPAPATGSAAPAHPAGGH